jgi:putative flippase GtrA
VQFIRFCLVGGVGFAVDSTVLLAGLWLGLDPLVVRIASIAAAGTTTWAINRRWTFAAPARTTRAKAREGLRYALVQTAGALVNYAIFALVVATFGRGPQPAMAGLVAGSTTALVLNFLGAKFLVFRAPAP